MFLRPACTISVFTSWTSYASSVMASKNNSSIKVVILPLPLVYRIYVCFLRKLLCILYCINNIPFCWSRLLDNYLVCNSSNTYLMCSYFSSVDTALSHILPKCFIPSFIEYWVMTWHIISSWSKYYSSMLALLYQNYFQQIMECI